MSKKKNPKQKKHISKLSSCCKSIQGKIGGDLSCFSNKTACKQNKRSFSIENPNKEEICRMDLDECIMKDDKEKKKCDFVFLRCKNGSLFFVELKGQDIGQAYKQITSSISHFQQRKVIEKKNKQLNIGAIICSRISPKHNTLQAKYKKEFARKWGKKLIIKSQNYSHKLVDE